MRKSGDGTEAKTYLKIAKKLSKDWGVLHGNKQKSSTPPVNIKAGTTCPVSSAGSIISAVGTTFVTVFTAPASFITATIAKIATLVGGCGEFQTCTLDKSTSELFQTCIYRCPFPPFDHNIDPPVPGNIDSCPESIMRPITPK